MTHPSSARPERADTPLPTGTGPLSVGKLRGLQRLAGAGDVFTMRAMDHRGSMQRLIDPDGPTTSASTRW
jgi:hypothetical protein